MAGVVDPYGTPAKAGTVSPSAGGGFGHIPGYYEYPYGVVWPGSNTDKTIQGQNQPQQPLEPWNQGPNQLGLLAALSANSQDVDAQQAGYNQQSAQANRMSTPTAGSVNSPASAASGGNVWVTVPVDKVQVANGKGTITPVYATTKGYKSPTKGNAIPPTPAAGRTF